jgi:hypothetical protein
MLKSISRTFVTLIACGESQAQMACDTMELVEIKVFGWWYHILTRQIKELVGPIFEEKCAIL